MNMDNRAFIHVERMGTDKVRHLYVDEYGKLIKSVSPYKQRIWEYSRTETEWKDIYGHDLQLKEIDNLKDYVDSNTGRKFAGQIDVKYQFLADEYKNGVSVDLSKIPKCYFDIEVSSSQGFPDPWEASQEITAIAFYMTSDKTKRCYGLKDYTGSDDTIEYYKFADEKELLQMFLSKIHTGVAVVVGWNINGFDIPYIINRANNIGIDLAKYLPLKKFYEKGDKFTAKSYCIPGIIRMDMMNLVKKYDLEKFERYSLDFVAKKYLGDSEGKVKYMDEFKSLQEFYEKDYNRFIEYAMKDVMLVVDIEETKKYIDLSFETAYRCNCLPEDVMSSIKVWDCYIYSNLIKNGIVVPKEKKSGPKADMFVGAYVSEPDRGMKDWVAIFDINSLYPNIIVSLNMSMITKIPDSKITDQRLLDIKSNISIDALLENKLNTDVLKEYNYSVSANGFFYDMSKQDTICKMIQEMFVERMKYKDLSKKETDKNKKQNYELKVNFYKVMMNSYYGCQGNQYFRFYDRDIASSVTTTGQYIIRKIGNSLDNRINSVFKDEK